MVKIRLQRCGCRNKPKYRVVVANSRSPRDGKFIEVIGFYNPLEKTDQKSKKLKIDLVKFNLWTKNGAQVTDRIACLLAS